MPLSPTDKLAKLRTFMRDEGVDAYVIPTADAHCSEYVPASEDRRSYITNFTGSAGTALVTSDEALLWTDGRYFLQAEKQLDNSIWKLMKQIPGVPTLEEYLSSSTKVQCIGMDPLCCGLSSFTTLEKKLGIAEKGTENSKSIKLITQNLVDLVWKDDGKPDVPANPVFCHDVKFAGKSVAAKLAEIREAMKSENAGAVLLTALDEIAWMFNLRGSDVSFNPVFISWGLITADSATLYTNPSRVEVSAKEALSATNVSLKDYNDIFEDLAALAINPNKVWISPTCNVRLRNILVDAHKGILEKRTPACTAKAVKNDVELEGMREAHIKDALAKVSFLALLKKMVADGSILGETELTLSDKLDQYRALMENAMGPSFESISSIGPNCAVIHYRPEEATAKPISKDIYLIDSGGQYREGTTDVTRTTHFGTPTAHQKRCYTNVLKGHIALRLITFPLRTPSTALDSLARQFLWKEGLDYLHGTGHGVGSFLNVHEGPQAITRPSERVVFLEPGMVLSNEPGYYEDGAFGIRIENLIFVKKAAFEKTYNDMAFYAFEDLTLIPYERDLICVSMLTEEEKAHLNAYHARCAEVISKRLMAPEIKLPHKELTLETLKSMTAPL